MFTHWLINVNGQLLPDDTTIRVLEMGGIWVVAAVLLIYRRRWERMGNAAVLPRG